MATPKYKTSKSNQVCPKCGYYNGKQVVVKDAE